MHIHAWTPVGLFTKKEMVQAFGGDRSLADGGGQQVWLDDVAGDEQVRLSLDAEETIGDVHDQAVEYKESLRDQVQDVADAFTDKINVFKNQIENKIEEIQNEVHHDINELNEEMDELKADVEEVKEAGAADEEEGEEE